MTLLCDFTEIVGDNPVSIGDGKPVWAANFNTGGRDSNSSAFLIFNVRGLTHTDRNVNVTVNNQPVGSIACYGGVTEAARVDNAKYYYTQMISLSGATLKDGINAVQINAVGHPGATSTNLYDDFQIKNMICFFHQAA